MKVLRVAAVLALSFAAGGGGTELALRARREVARVREAAEAPRLAAVQRVGLGTRDPLGAAAAPRLLGWIQLADGTRLAIFELPVRCPACDAAVTGA